VLSYMTYYNGTRTHLSLNKDAPVPVPVGNLVRLATEAESRNASAL